MTNCFLKNSHHEGEKEPEQDESKYNYEVALPEQQVREKIQPDFRNAPFVWLQLTEEGQQMAEASTSEGTLSPGSPQGASANSSRVRDNMQQQQQQQNYAMQQQNYQMYGQIPPPPPHPHPGLQGQQQQGQQPQQQMFEKRQIRFKNINTKVGKRSNSE